MARLRLAPALVVAALTWAAGAPVRAEEGFVAALGDVPLMPGLALAADEGLSFDTPAGRIVEAVAYDTSGRLDAEAVGAFYAESLPQLGWAATGAGAFRREGEVLELDIGRRGGALRVRFFLKPG